LTYRQGLSHSASEHLLDHMLFKLADSMQNRDFLVDWPGCRDSLQTGSVPAKTGRMVCLCWAHSWAQFGGDTGTCRPTFL